MKKRILPLLFLLAINLLSPRTVNAAVGGDCCDYSGRNSRNYAVQYNVSDSDPQCKMYEVVNFLGQVTFWDSTALDDASYQCSAAEVCYRSGTVRHELAGSYPRYRCMDPNNLPADVVPFCNGDSKTVRTAFGCISTDPAIFASQAIKLGISIGSGIAFLLIIYGSFKLLTSQGNPEGINQGKEIITSAIVGLLLIILSVTILQIIGVDILGLNTLGLEG